MNAILFSNFLTNNEIIIKEVPACLYLLTVCEYITSKSNLCFYFVLIQLNIKLKKNELCALTWRNTDYILNNKV